MANIVANLCLEVTSAGLSVSVYDRATGERGTYWFRVYPSRDVDPDPVQGESVEVSGTGARRVVAWDAKPDATQSSLFTEPTWVDPTKRATFEGGAFEVGSADLRNPWPPT